MKRWEKGQEIFTTLLILIKEKKRKKKDLSAVNCASNVVIIKRRDINV